MTNNTNTNTVNMIEVIKSARNASDYAERIADYTGSSGYISDIFQEIADGETSIYYSDIIKYIADNVEAVNDAIQEFGWDGCGADLYKAGQMAEYLAIERDLYNNEDEVKQLYAANYIRHEYGEEIPAETWSAVLDALDNIGTGDRLNDIDDAIQEIFNLEEV